MFPSRGGLQLVLFFISLISLYLLIADFPKKKDKKDDDEWTFSWLRVGAVLVLLPTLCLFFQHGQWPTQFHSWVVSKLVKEGTNEESESDVAESQPDPEAKDESQPESVAKKAEPKKSQPKAEKPEAKPVVKTDVKKAEPKKSQPKAEKPEAKTTVAKKAEPKADEDAVITDTLPEPNFTQLPGGALFANNPVPPDCVIVAKYDSLSKPLEGIFRTNGVVLDTTVFKVPKDATDLQLAFWNKKRNQVSKWVPAKVAVKLEEAEPETE